MKRWTDLLTGAVSACQTPNWRDRNNPLSGGMCCETPIEIIGELAFRQRGIVGGALPTVQR